MSGTMTESTDTSADETAQSQAVDSGLRSQLGMMIRAIFGTQVYKKLIILVVCIVVVVVVTAYGQIRLNGWNKPFFDALSRRDLHDFFVQLGVFFMIVGCLLVLNVAQRWLVETLKYKLREGLVGDLVGLWMLPRRAFWLANAGAMGVNPDQRMHDDARNLSDMSGDLSVGLFQAALLFITFAGVLWNLSADFSVRIGGVDYAIPGFMLWAAIAYATTGSLLSYWVGHRLIQRNEERYAREADLRFSLVRVNEHLDGISLAEGEADEKRRIELHLANVLKAMRRIVAGHARLTWVTAGFGWITGVAPTLVAAPLYFMGKISFGGLMMAAAAFTQAQSSLRWFVDNFSILAEWRATLLRVASFRHALVATDGLPGIKSRIAYSEGEPRVMTIEDLKIESPTGCDMLKESKVVVNAGERVLVVGAPGTSKTSLFRALAGLWPWGMGHIVRPRDEQILFVPRGTPYLPRGTLREVLAYPFDVGGFGDAQFIHALTRLGLERLLPLLDETQRWDRELGLDEQLDLAFARILLLAPPWLLIDDMFGSLDDEALERVIDVFNNELQHCSIIHIGRATQSRDTFFSRVLHLVRAPAKQPDTP
jgi:putative ATP-binding cassette transporter